MTNLQAELSRIHALEWDKIPAELEALAVRLAEERGKQYDDFALVLDGDRGEDSFFTFMYDGGEALVSSFLDDRDYGVSAKLNEQLLLDLKGWCNSALDHIRAL